jgi:excisionase family DNA binding protein
MTEIFKQQFLTQKEVAELFRVSQGTIINWRNQGLLSYWQAPGSSKILYYRDEVEEFRDQNTTIKKGGGASEKRSTTKSLNR